RPGATVNIQLPARGVVRPAVELFDQLQVRQQVRAERGVNGNALGNSRQHLLLHQSRVEVRGIKRDESDQGGISHVFDHSVRGPRTAFRLRGLPRGQSGIGGGPCQQRTCSCRLQESPPVDLLVPHYMLQEQNGHHR